MVIETKHQMIDAAKRRHYVAYKLSLITGLDQEVAGQMLIDYVQRLDQLLSGCDKCVRNWHMGRKAYLKELSE